MFCMGLESNSINLEEVPEGILRKKSGRPRLFYLSLSLRIFLRFSTSFPHLTTAHINDLGAETTAKFKNFRYLIFLKRNKPVL